MRPKISEEARKEAIRLWLLGLSRDNIANVLDVSSGAVTNIVDEWKRDSDNGDADALRELGKSIHVSGVPAAQYAASVRITNILAKKGVSPYKAEQFLSTTFEKCEKRGIPADMVVYYIEDLADLTDGIRLPEVEQYIKQKANEKEELDKQIPQLEEKVSSLKREMVELEKKRNDTLEAQRKEGEDLKDFLEAKRELEKLGISLDDPPKFARAVRALAECRYRPRRIISKANEITKFTLKKEELQQEIDLYSEILPIYRELEYHGVGHRELLTILEAVMKISRSNGIPSNLAVNKFINDIKTQYDSKLGFEAKIEDLKCQPSAFQIVNQLYDLGLKNHDIMQLAKVYLTISKQTYSVEDMATGLAKIADLMSSTMNKSDDIQNDKVVETVKYVREKLSQIHFAT